MGKTATTPFAVLPEPVEIDGRLRYPVRAHDPAFARRPLVQACTKAQRRVVVRNPKTRRIVGGWARKMGQSVLLALNEQLRQATNRVRNGRDPLPVGWEENWAAMMHRLQRPILRGAGDDGFAFGGEVLSGGRSGKAFEGAVEKSPSVLTATGADDEDGYNVGILEDGEHHRRIDGFLDEVASAHTKTNAKRIQRIHDKAIASWNDEKKTGWTPRDIAKELLTRGVAQNRSHAVMIALTDTAWAFNAGARARYEQAGVGALEWMTTHDDSVCPFCAGMDGVKVRTSDPFWEAGSEYGVEVDGKLRVMKLPYAVEHPPVHPNCQCVLLPVIQGAT